jgi:hypothetical protein
MKRPSLLENQFSHMAIEFYMFVVPIAIIAVSSIDLFSWLTSLPIQLGFSLLQAMLLYLAVLEFALLVWWFVLFVTWLFRSSRRLR